MPPFVRIWFAHHHVTLTQAVVAFTIYFCVAYGCGIVMAAKRRNYVVGFLLAFFLPVVGALWVLLTPTAGRVRVRTARESSPGAEARARAAEASAAAAPPPDMATCSFCGLNVPLSAEICRVCQTALQPRRNAAEVAA